MRLNCHLFPTFLFVFSLFINLSLFIYFLSGEFLVSRLFFMNVFKLLSPHYKVLTIISLYTQRKFSLHTEEGTHRCRRTGNGICPRD